MVVARYKLKLKRLDFVSVVDQPAQEPATCLLIKRRGNSDEIVATAQLVKVSAPLGLAFFWAFKSTDANGDAYHDLQGDQVLADDAMIKAAAEFMEHGGAVDQQHDNAAIGKVVFAMPMNPEIAAAYGVTTKQSGLMVALRPSADVLKKLQSGEYTGVSIEGLGERQKVAGMQVKCEKCSSFVAKDADECPSCGAAMPGYKRAPVGKAVWTTAMIDDLPDNSFLYVEPGGKKDDGGKTQPRSLRHFPYKDENGKIDIDHLRDAASRIPQSSLPATLRNKLQVKAEKLIAAQHGDTAKRFTKQALLTTAVAGHVHMLDDGGDAPSGETDYRPMPEEADGGYHSHPWVRSSDGTIVIGEAENHVHAVLAPDDIDAIVASGDIDDDEDDAAKRAGISTRADRAAQADTTTEKSTMADQDLKKQFDEAVAKVARLEKMATLTDAQRAHLGKLAESDRDVYLAKSASDRDADVAKALAADEVVHTLDGIEYRKSAGPATLAIVKRALDTAAALAKRDAELDAERLAKRADAELKFMKGTTATRAALLKAIDGIADEKLRGEVATALTATLSSAASAIALMEKHTGVTVKSEDAAGNESGIESFNKGLAAFAKTKNIEDPRLATSAYLHTNEGAALYAAAQTA